MQIGFCAPPGVLPQLQHFASTLTKFFEIKRRGTNCILRTGCHMRAPTVAAIGGSA